MVLVRAGVWALSNTLKCLGRLYAFLAFLKYLTAMLKKQLQIFMPAIFKHGKYASLIQYHSCFFYQWAPSRQLQVRSYPFSHLTDQLLGIHATVNIYQKISVFSNINVAVMYADHCSMPQDCSTFIVATFYAV